MPQFNLFKSSEQPVAKTPGVSQLRPSNAAVRHFANWYAGCKRLIFSCSECAQQRTALVEYEEVNSAR